MKMYKLTRLGKARCHVFRESTYLPKSGRSHFEQRLVWFARWAAFLGEQPSSGEKVGVDLDSHYATRYFVNAMKRALSEGEVEELL